mmetsp:Transcript_3574/g.11108  ORF Transcript_3574/g.11108 Transcript_3574/m.11108 type:complete len:645 (-) Transcript_3574:38-1972(-)
MSSSSVAVLRFSTFSLLFFLLTVQTLVCATPQVIHVDVHRGQNSANCGTSASPCASLVYASQQQMAGETLILVSGGTYEGSANFPLYLPQGTTLRSTDGASKTVLNCQGSKACILTSTTDQSVLIDGFTITTYATIAPYGLIVARPSQNTTLSRLHNSRSLAEGGSRSRGRSAVLLSNRNDHHMSVPSSFSSTSSTSSSASDSMSSLGYPVELTASSIVNVTLANSVVSSVQGTSRADLALIDSTVPLFLVNTSFENVYAPASTLVRSDVALTADSCRFVLLSVLNGMLVSGNSAGPARFTNSNLHQVTVGNSFLATSAAIQVENVRVTAGVGRFLLGDFLSPTAAVLVQVAQLHVSNVSLSDGALLSVSSFEILAPPISDPFVIVDSVFESMPEHALLVYTNGTSLTVKNLQCFGTSQSVCIAAVNSPTVSLTQVYTSPGIVIKATSTPLPLLPPQSNVILSDSVLAGSILLSPFSVQIVFSALNSSFQVQPQEQAFVIQGESAASLSFSNCSFASSDQDSTVAFECLSSSNSSTPLDSIVFSDANPSIFLNISITSPSAESPSCTNVNCGTDSGGCEIVYPPSDSSSHKDSSSNSWPTTGFIVGTAVSCSIAAILLISVVVYLIYHRMKTSRGDGYEPIAAI